VNRLVALAILTAAFAPAAVMGALPMVISIVALLATCWFLFAAWTDSTDSAAEPPVTPVV
jgi:fatty acid desaturase